MERSQFVDRLNQFVHPSEEISIPDQLQGRDDKLRNLRDCFETNGSHGFVWGLRGVGKTSLVHTACNKYSETVKVAASIACEENSTPIDLLNDIIRRVTRNGKVEISNSGISAKLSVPGLTAEKKQSTYITLKDPPSVNYASDLLQTILPEDFETRKIWVIVIDEFDQLQNKTTINFFTALAKQLSVDKVPVKFVFCGVASNLNDLIGGHESVDRYIKAINLEPLPHDKIQKIGKYICTQFGVEMNRGQLHRLSQISSGYPHFTHLIMRGMLLSWFEDEQVSGEISGDIYKSGMQDAARSAATRLQDAYENSTRKGTDKYIEILWATADGQHLVKQFKEIKKDYRRIMLDRERDGRSGIEDDKLLRNHLNNLCKESHGAVLHRGKVGWYSFCDPMFRSYVRMMAHNDGIDLGDESFSN